MTTISPAHDQQDLAAQGAQRPGAGEAVSSPSEVFSEDWWGNARPIIEVHGYFRTRAELFHNLFLGRHNSTLNGNDQASNLFPIPLDQTYTSLGNNGNTAFGSSKCGSNGTSSCYDKTESGANLRLRINPEIHISDNLRIVTQLDLLNNLVLGSTPDSYAMQPAGASSANSVAHGYTSAGFNGYAPLSAFTTTQGSPTAGVNSFQNAVNVNRAWAEYMTPLGQIRFGRMPQQWGLGMVANSGDGIDSDYQSTIDRVMFVTGLKSLNLYFGGGWDFPSTGPTNANPFDVYGGQPYNTCNLCNVNQWMLFAAHRTNPELQKLKLAQGDIVLNGGALMLFRSQYMDVAPGTTNLTVDTSGAVAGYGLVPSRSWAFIPDGWVQALWRKFRFEAEFVTIQGQTVALNPSNVNQSAAVRQYGLATQTELRAIDDKLDLQFGFGWASGDAYTASGGLQPPTNGLQTETTQNGQPSSISTFHFHPDYRVDLIFFRNILTRVEGAYYFRPSVDYDFLRHADGEKFGGGAAVIWSRASEFVQAPGHRRDLGVELDLSLYYQSKDGSLNDDPSKLGGFFTMLQYGVFFPLAGLDYLPGQVPSGFDAGLSAAQIVRLFLGVVYCLKRRPWWSSGQARWTTSRYKIRPSGDAKLPSLRSRSSSGVALATTRLRWRRSQRHSPGRRAALHRRSTPATRPMRATRGADLYKCYFGPGTQASSCTAQGVCHGNRGPGRGRVQRVRLWGVPGKLLPGHERDTAPRRRRRPHADHPLPVATDAGRRLRKNAVLPHHHDDRRRLEHGLSGHGWSDLHVHSY